MSNNPVYIDCGHIKRKRTLLIASAHVIDKITYTSLEHLAHEEENKSSAFILHSSRKYIATIKDAFLTGDIGRVVVVSPHELYSIVGVMVEDRAFSMLS